MNIPYGLLGVSIVFWGWQAELLAVALFMALLVELPVFFTARFKLATRDFELISNLCTCLVVLLALYLVFYKQLQYMVIFLLEFLPLPLFPLLVGQRYSKQDQIDFSALFYSLRKRKAKSPDIKTGSFNFEVLYLGVCLLAAGAANQRTDWYYPVVLILLACLLWQVRPKSNPSVWVLLFLLAGGLGYGGQLGLQHLQKFMQKRFVSSILDSRDDSMDLFRAGTSLGGNKKLSDRILFRVKGADPANKGVYIRKAVFDIYNRKDWYASEKFGRERLTPDKEEGSFLLNPGNASTRKLRIFKQYQHDPDYLLLPKGAAKINGLSASYLQITASGTVIVHDPKKWSGYSVSCLPAGSILGDPVESDLQISPKLREEIKGVATELDIVNAEDPEKVIRVLQRFFRKEFDYSLNHSSRSETGSLEEFLFHSRAGDCEHFATATALLLRIAGIPTRYVTGYLAHRFDENIWVVRKSDAHAWVTAYLDGNWVRVDTTPGGRTGRDLGLKRRLWDMLSHIGFEINRFRYSEKSSTPVFYAGVVLLFMVMSLSILRRWRQKRRFEGGTEGVDTSLPLQGADSEFYSLERVLRSRGLQRPDSQPLMDWISAQEDPWLKEILLLHYKYRFDPEGLTTWERNRLRELVQEWLRQYQH